MYYNPKHNGSQNPRNVCVVKCPQQGHNVTEPRLRAFAGSCVSCARPVIILEELSTSKEAEGIGVFLRRGLNSCPPGETHYCAYVSVYMGHTFNFWAVCSSRQQGKQVRTQTHNRRECESTLPHDTFNPKWHTRTLICLWCNYVNAVRFAGCWNQPRSEKHASELIYVVTQQ